MARYINLDELLNAIDKQNGRLPLWLDEILMEDCKVADVAPVVRCKDCKHFLFDTEYCKEHNRGYCEFDNTIKTRNHFCGYGERKDG